MNKLTQGFLQADLSAKGTRKSNPNVPNEKDVRVKKLNIKKKIKEKSPHVKQKVPVHDVEADTT
jgi:hypothetical protein